MTEFTMFTCANTRSALDRKKWRFFNVKHDNYKEFERVEIGTKYTTSEARRWPYMNFHATKIKTTARALGRGHGFYYYSQALPTGYTDLYCNPLRAFKPHSKGWNEYRNRQTFEGYKDQVTFYYDNLIKDKYGKLITDKNGNPIIEPCAINIRNVPIINGGHDIVINVTRNMDAINDNDRKITYIVSDSLIVASKNDERINTKQLIERIPEITGNEFLAALIIPILKSEDDKERDKLIRRLRTIASHKDNQPDKQLDQIFEIIDKANALEQHDIANQLRASSFSGVPIDGSDSIYSTRLKAVKTALHTLSELDCEETKLWVELFNEELSVPFKEDEELLTKCRSKEILFYQTMRRSLHLLPLEKCSLGKFKEFSPSIKDELDKFIEKKNKIKQNYKEQELQLIEKQSAKNSILYHGYVWRAKKSILIPLVTGLTLGGLVVSGLTFNPVVIAIAITAIAVSIALFTLKSVVQFKISRFERQYKKEFIDVCEVNDQAKKEEEKELKNKLGETLREMFSQENEHGHESTVCNSP